jgi:cell division protein ZapB
MDSELAALEQKLAKLLADYHRVRAENESLKRELARAQDHVKALNGRVAAATTRLDSLLQQLPESAS